MANSRSLLTFAFAADAYEKSGDILDAILPLFAPLAQERKGRSFDAIDLCDWLQATYGLAMLPYTAELFSERMVQVGLLQREVKRAGELIYCEPESSLIAPDEGELTALIQHFQRFIQIVNPAAISLIGLDRLGNGLIERLISTDFLSLTFKKDRNFSRPGTLGLREAPDGDPDNEIMIDYLVARYVIDVSENDPKTFSLIEKITAGALLAEVVLDLQDPPTRDTIPKGFTVVVDAPMVMDALGLSDDKHGEYATRLFSLLKTKNVRVSVFEHSLDEIRNAIKVTFESWKSTRMAFGPLARKLRTRAGYGAYVQALQRNLVAEIERLGLEVFEPSKYEESKGYSYFNKKDEEALTGALAHYKNEGAREHDVSSVSTIFRLRSGTLNESNLFETGVVFVTRNGMLARRTREFLIAKKKLGAAAVPPCLTDRLFSAALWLTIGGTASELTRARLIANCAAAIQPRNDVMTKMVSILTGINPEVAEKFEALMINDRAAQVLMDKAAGDYRALNTEDALEIYESALDEVVRLRAFKMLEEKDGAIKAADGKLVREQKAFEKEKSELKSELSLAQEQLENERRERAQAEVSATYYESEIGRMRAELSASQLIQVKSCLMGAVRRARMIVAATIFAILILPFLAELYFDESVELLVFQTLGLLAASAYSASAVFDGHRHLLSPVSERMFWKDITALGLDGVAQMYQFDFFYGFVLEEGRPSGSVHPVSD